MATCVYRSLCQNDAVSFKCVCLDMEMVSLKLMKNGVVYICILFSSVDSRSALFLLSSVHDALGYDL